jgi:hypothetical protein
MTNQPATEALLAYIRDVAGCTTGWPTYRPDRIVVIDHATSPSLDAFVPNATLQSTTPRKQEENSQKTKNKLNDEQPKCYRTKKEAMTPYYKAKKQTTLNNPSHNMTEKQKKGNQ